MYVNQICKDMLCISNISYLYALYVIHTCNPPQKKMYYLNLVLLKTLKWVAVCDVPHQWIAQQVGPVSVYCDGVGCCVLCLPHGIPVWQHIGQVSLLQAGTIVI